MLYSHGYDPTHPENEPSRELQKMMLSYMKNRQGLITPRNQIMDAIGLSMKREPLGAPVKFHWALLRLNDELAAHGVQIKEFGLERYELVAI